MTKLCPRGKAAAKRKFKVYPSAYANAYASKICAGKIKDPSGVKRKDFRGPKPAATGGMMKNDEKNKQADPAKLIKKRKDSKKEALERMKKELGMRKGAMIKASRGAALSAATLGLPAKNIEEMKKKLGTVSESQMQERSGREKARKVKRKLKNIGNQIKGFGKEMIGKKVGGMTAGSRSALGRIQKANMVKAREGEFIRRRMLVAGKRFKSKGMGTATDYQKYLKGLKKATGKAPVTGKAPAKSRSVPISGKTLDKQLMKTKNPYSDLKKMTEAGPKNYKRALGERALKAAKATRIGKIAAGVAGAALVTKAALEKMYEKRTGKKPFTKRRTLVDKKSKGGLKAELNNPAKGYTKGGMADYYKDLM